MMFAAADARLLEKWPKNNKQTLENELFVSYHTYAKYAYDHIFNFSYQRGNYSSRVPSNSSSTTRTYVQDVSNSLTILSARKAGRCGVDTWCLTCSLTKSCGSRCQLSAAGLGSSQRTGRPPKSQARSSEFVLRRLEVEGGSP